MCKSNNSTFVSFIFETSKFRNIGRSTFGLSKFWPPPDSPFRKLNGKKLLLKIFQSGSPSNNFKSLNFENRGRYPALGYPLPWAIGFFFKWGDNKYFSLYAYCFIFKSHLLNSNFVKKNSYFILFFLKSDFSDEQSKFFHVLFYWNKKVKHRFIYERKFK